MKSIKLIAVSALLLGGTFAHAQDSDAGPEVGPEDGAHNSSPMTMSATPDASSGDQAHDQRAGVETDFTDAQIEAYAAAAIALREKQADPATDAAGLRTEAPEILASAGIDEETYLAISEAMQTDPEVAQRVQLAVANLRGQTGA